MPSVDKKGILPRQKEITYSFLKELDKHLSDLKEGRAERTLEINDIAAILHIHPTHLSNTIKEVTGKSPCDFYEEKLMAIARQLLSETNMSIGEVADRLTFDPSNFTKFFKHFDGITPRQYRQSIIPKSDKAKTELVTK